MGRDHRKGSPLFVHWIVWACVMCVGVFVCAHPCVCTPKRLLVGQVRDR